MSEALQTAIASQRLLLQTRLSAALSRLQRPCREAWGDRAALEQALSEAMEMLPYCKYLYLLDHQARQITANVARRGLLPEHFDRDRTSRPYMAEALSGTDFSLSSAYLSRNNRRPSLTAVQRLTRSDGELLGYLGADFDLRDLPLTRELCRQSDQWLQLKGDPAIRGALFYQQRVDSLMDSRIDAILDLVIELMSSHGVFHGKLHFSSSRATLWLLDDPYHFRVLDYEDLSDPAICLAYPLRAYPDDAAIPSARIRAIFNQFRELRFMDENIYLRSGSLNIMNGLVALNFSCDGSHYMRWDEFLDKRMDFWLGSAAPTCSESEKPKPAD
ncbi:PDC sensor domain-containing protein [Lamprobacter modestohalophilus]|uniref:PDC sensor domain-containing protein n=1 Tax=Lamprobacter modestohalophilus TaxID=1064514 RepID=UPI002ADEC2FE|nr:PDC sensor domain-containing protein [Lamprobacter modestohalophilus]MEA1049620.1 PDC sensor domain-containing protein [Lamprobacter modestohalophilus]